MRSPACVPTSKPVVRPIRQACVKRRPTSPPNAAALDEILDTIAYNDRLIAQKRAEQAATWDPFVDFGLELEIQALQFANTVQYGYRAVAKGALDIAIGALRLIEGGLEIIPVDADPRIVALVIAREAAMLVLNAATGVLGLVPDEIRAQIEFTIGTAGVFGDASIETCTDGACSVVVGGTVSSNPPQLCFVLLEVEICVGLGELDLR